MVLEKQSNANTPDGKSWGFYFKPTRFPHDPGELSLLTKGSSPNPYPNTQGTDFTSPSLELHAAAATPSRLYIPKSFFLPSSPNIAQFLLISPQDSTPKLPVLTTHSPLLFLNYPFLRLLKTYQSQILVQTACVCLVAKLYPTILTLWTVAH